MCKCKHTESGVYENQVVLDFPPHMLEHYKESGKTNINVDACIADEIKDLWAHGIRTTGCCCGHNWKFPYIGVVPDDIAKMKALGYKPQYNPWRPPNEDTFFPKVYYPYHNECGKCGDDFVMCENCETTGCPECNPGWKQDSEGAWLCPECYNALKDCPDFYQKDEEDESK